jgi:hypothetical protein
VAAGRPVANSFPTANDGGMSLLAARPGYARLAEPIRFRNQWEQQASLRLRDGDTSVLAEYDQHGRSHGGDPEQTMGAAAAAYTALSTAGTDTLLMAADHALRPELGYAVTDHAAPGRTVHTALAVITGAEDRQHAYVALTRGTDANHA